MKVYAETNFLLEIALRQEERETCEAIIRLCRAHRSLELVVPGFSLVEPHATLHRRHRDRKELAIRLDQELVQLTRTHSYAAHRPALEEVRELLIESASDEQRRYRDTSLTLVEHARIIPLTAQVARDAHEYTSAFDLDYPDAIVLASVLSDLDQEDSATHCAFLTKNIHDFNNPSVIALLKARRCKLFWRFQDALGYLTTTVGG